MKVVIGGRKKERERERFLLVKRLVKRLAKNANKFKESQGALEFKLCSEIAILKNFYPLRPGLSEQMLFRTAKFPLDVQRIALKKMRQTAGFYQSLRLENDFATV